MYKATPNSRSNSVSNEFLRACQKGDLKTLENMKKLEKIENWTTYRHDVSGDTGLHVAAREGHLDVVEYLCQAWQLPLYKADVTNKDMKRPLHEAAQFSRSEILQYLIQKGTSTSSKSTLTNNFSSSWQYLPSLDASINSLKRADWTPLMLACTKSGSEARRCIQILLDAGADPCTKNSDGWNSLFIACRSGDADAVALLLRRAPGCVDTRSNNGRSPLHIAAFHGAADNIIDQLLATNPNILHARDSTGSTALHESAKSGVLSVTKRLIERGANPQAVDDVGQSILHLAAACESLEIIQYILANKLVNIDLEDQFGVTPLMAACRYKRKLAIDILNKFRANK